MKDLEKSLELFSKKLLDDIKAGGTEQLKEYLKFASKFPKYSFNNQILIKIQMPESTWVCSYVAWKKLGRQVVDKSKIKIFVPKFNKNKKQIDDEVIEEKKLSGFALGSVFDISQTIGHDIPSHPEIRVESDNDFGLYQDLKEIMEKNGIVVEEQSYKGALGVSFGGKVFIEPKQSLGSKALTLLHEYAHEILHKGSENSQLTKAEKECQAEATAYIVGAYIGLDLPISSDYMIGWGTDVAIFEKSMASVTKAVKKIVTELEGRVLNGTVCEENILADVA